MEGVVGAENGREEGEKNWKTEAGDKKRGRRNGAREGKKHRLQRLFVHVSAPMGREPSLFHAFRRLLQPLLPPLNSHPTLPATVLHSYAIFRGVSPRHLGAG